MDSFDVKVPLTLLKNALSFACKLNQTINQLRRNFIKPSLPVQYARLDSSEHLFRDSITITDTLESLQKENKQKNCWKKSQNFLEKGNTHFHNGRQTSKPLPRP